MTAILSRKQIAEERGAIIFSAFPLDEKECGLS
jgi:hypothetical protein